MPITSLLPLTLDLLGMKATEAVFKIKHRETNIRWIIWVFGFVFVLPSVIVGDEAFRLLRHIMKLYTRRFATEDPTKAIFNYRISRARRFSENAFKSMLPYLNSSRLGENL